MRTGPDKPWMPVVAEQYFSVNPPGFVWSVNARMKGVLPIAGRDRYADGHGHMLIKLASLLTVADGVGAEIDQGAMLRYLGEIVWFPSAALSDSVSWEAIDERSARAAFATSRRQPPRVKQARRLAASTTNRCRLGGREKPRSG
jgi:hypothetical protein